MTGGGAASTVGVDIAVDPANTAACRIDWAGSAATVQEILFPATDEQIVAQVVEAGGSVGIDCALGWPDEFVDFVVGHREGRPVEPRWFDDPAAWRRSLAYRRTDAVVREVTGRWPLSVSTDRLGLTAMRTAGLVTRLSEAGVSGGRADEPPVFEVYPAAALRCWGMPLAGYKRSAEVRAGLLDELGRRLPTLHLAPVRGICVEIDHAFDALVAALATRAAALGQLVRPDPADRARAAREGWIVLPTMPLERLVSPHA